MVGPSPSLPESEQRRATNTFYGTQSVPSVPLHKLQGLPAVTRALIAEADAPQGIVQDIGTKLRDGLRTAPIPDIA
ncbi:MAG: hypothetical protein MK098_04670 [Marinovum sp.]|nr:hypothetical protein [Marinovum sp.]